MMAEDYVSYSGEVVWIPIDKIVPYWRNPRINERTVQALVKFIKRVGFNVPLVIDNENVVIKGHTRLKAARLLKMSKVPCLYSKNDAEINRRDRIADNRVSDFSLWNSEQLIEEREKLRLEDAELYRVAFETVWHDRADLEMELDTALGEGEVPLPDEMVSTDNVRYVIFMCPYCGNVVKVQIDESLHLRGAEND